MPKAKILIVEDDTITAKIIERALQNTGYEVTAIAKSGSETFSQIKKNPPDLVLVDIKLQGKMDGIEVADQILTKFDMPVVYLTASTDEATLGRIKETEPFGYITKPFDSKELHGVIETSLHKHGVEKKLRESEEKYRRLHEAITDSVFVLDREWRYVMANDVSAKLVKIPKNKLIGKKITDIFKGIESSSFFMTYRKVMESRKPDTAIDRFQHEDGREGWYEVNVYPSPDGIFCIVRNITERKQAEEALRVRDSAIASSINSIAFADLEGNLIYVNPSFLELWGYDDDKEILGKSTLLFWLLEDKATEVIETLRDKGSWIGELVARRKDQSLFDVQLSANMVMDKDDKPICMMASFMDITDRKRAVEDLRESHEKLQSLLSSMNDMYFSCDMVKYKMFEVSSACEKIYGRTQKQWMQNPNTWMEMTHPDSREDVEKQTLLLKKGEDVEGENKIIRDDGEIRWIYAKMHPTLDNQGNWIRLEAMVSDITEQKKAEEQIQKNLKEKQVLLKEIHHRVKNNLQVISSLLGLQATYIKDKQALEILKDSRDRVRSMALVHEGLYRSKDIANINFPQYIKKLTNQLVKTYIIDSSKIELDFKFEDVFLGVDQAVPCGLIVNELVSNALKHAFPPSFEGKCKIEIAVHPPEAGEIELIVKDNGVGIPKELDIRKSESLGLKLVPILAEDQLGGKVKLDRSGGTKFTIRFKRENL